MKTYTEDELDNIIDDAIGRDPARITVILDSVAAAAEAIGIDFEAGPQKDKERSRLWYRIRDIVTNATSRVGTKLRHAL